MLPREKFLKMGVDNLTDTDLLAILIGTGVKGKNFMGVARAVLRKIRGTISDDNQLEIDDIVSVSGVGAIKGMQILSGVELGRRLYGLNSKDRILVQNSKDAYEYLKDIGKKKQEHIVGLFLNARFEILDSRVICIGSLDNVSVLPRDVIIHALELNASSVVLAHNHPSNDPRASSEDYTITRRIKEALELVGLELLDHIIICKDGWSRVDI